MTDWTDLSARASIASHKLIGWVYWDPGAIERYAALGIPNGAGYYITSRAAPLCAAGPDVVAAAYYSIHPGFIAGAMALCEEHTDYRSVYDARNEAVVAGLLAHSADIVDGLAELADPLWEAALSLPVAARPLHAAHRSWPRGDGMLSAWLAINCIREWRGDTHWAILAAHDLTGTEAGILHNAWMNYDEDWIPRSRGADDAALDDAWSSLAGKGWASVEETRRVVTAEGIAVRSKIESDTNRQAERAWRHLGPDRAQTFLDLVEPVADRYLALIDQTAGPNWMPAARTRRP